MPSPPRPRYNEARLSAPAGRSPDRRPAPGGKEAYLSTMTWLKSLFRRETVFCVSALLAALSALAVPPDLTYLS